LVSAAACGVAKSWPCAGETSTWSAVRFPCKGRTIVLSAAEVEELRTHRARQAEGLLALGVRLTDDHHVVARADGQPLQPRSLTHAFVKFARQHGFQIRLHDLRHSHATHMLASGVHPKIAQERLGHSSVGITLDLYSHVLPGMQAEAVSKVDAALRDALDRRTAKKKEMVAKG
jgi:integrase